MLQESYKTYLSKNNRFSLFALGSSHVKFDVWPWPNMHGAGCWFDQRYGEPEKYNQSNSRAIYSVTQNTRENMSKQLQSQTSCRDIMS